MTIGCRRRSTWELGPFAVLMAGLFLVSCVARQQYHWDPNPCAEGPQACPATFLEEHSEYLLGFVELDDSGKAWDTAQRTSLLRTLQEELEERDVLMVVFVHGWNHNSQTCDRSVTCFRELLSSLHAAEEALSVDRPARRVVGVYVGWRGARARGKLLRPMSFGRSVSTAEDVGSGSLKVLLAQLNEIRNQQNARRFGSSTRLVIVGDGLGGTVVFSAVQKSILTSLTRAEIVETEATGIGDLVVLVNPAVAASRYKTLHDMAEAQAESFGGPQAPIMAILTSQGDSATGQAFPMTRRFSRGSGESLPGATNAERKQLERRTVGHYPPYRTHFLESSAATPEPIIADVVSLSACECPYFLAQEGATPSREQVVETIDSARHHDWEESPEMHLPTSTLVHEKHSAHGALQVISVDAQIVPSHSNTFQPAFVDFLRYYIALAVEPR